MWSEPALGARQQEQQPQADDVTEVEGSFADSRSVERGSVVTVQVSQNELAPLPGIAGAFPTKPCSLWRTTMIPRAGAFRVAARS